MAEYIDRKEAVSAAREGADAWDGGCNASRDKYLAEYIGSVPAADVAPVRHGRWGAEIHGIERSVCSECRAVYEGGPFNYCAKYGAKMDGEVLKREDQNSSALSYDFDIGWSVRV